MYFGAFEMKRKTMTSVGTEPTAIALIARIFNQLSKPANFK